MDRRKNANVSKGIIVSVVTFYIAITLSPRIVNNLKQGVDHPCNFLQR